MSCQLLQLDAMMDMELKLEKLGNLFQFFCCMLRKIIAANSALSDEICLISSLS